jgi:hypothetical protein
MVILNPQIIYKIEGMKRLEKVRICLRFLYICILTAGTVSAITLGRFEEFSYLIVICLISTYAVSVATDFYISDFDSALQVLEYEKCKFTYEHSEQME